MRILIALALCACAHGSEPQRRMPAIVCGRVPDGDYCCVSVRAERLIQLCGDDVKQHDEMRNKLDKNSL